MKEYAPIMMTFFVIFGLSALVSFWSGNAWYTLPLGILLLISVSGSMIGLYGIMNLELEGAYTIRASDRWLVYGVFSVSLIVATLTIMYFLGTPEMVYEPRTFMLQ